MRTRAWLANSHAFLSKTRFDFPETVSTYQDLAALAGFSQTKEIVTDKHGQMKILALVKEA